MRRRIKSARIRFISLVPKGANKMPVLLKDDGAVTLKTVVSKYDATEGLLTAVVYAPEFRDAQGDVASADVIKDMAHEYLVNGRMIDIRHDGKPLSKEQAAVVESFIVQKGDPRFEGIEDYDGNPVDVEGAWAAVIKLLDPDLKKLYEDGKYNGVSMGGTADVEVEKEESPMTKEEIAALAETISKSTATAVAEALKSDREEQAKLQKQADEKKADDDAKQAESAPVFKGDHSDPSALIAFQKELELFNLRKGVDFSDPAAVADYAQKVAEVKKKHEGEQKSDPAPSNQGAGTTPTGPTDEVAKEVSIGKEMAKLAGWG